MATIIDNLKEELDCLFREHKVKTVYLFGSSLTGDWDSGSDIDFLINFDEGLEPLKKGELWWSLRDKLRELLGRDIDLINEKSIKNPYFKEEVEKTKARIYG